MEKKNESSIDILASKLKLLEERIAKIENYLQHQTTHFEEEEPQKLFKKDLEQSSDTLEFQIGQYWFARAGIVVLAVGIAFLLTLQFKNFPAIVPSLFGLFIVVGLVALSQLKHKSFEYLSQYFLGGSLVLLYFTILRLHFFSDQPVISDKIVELLLLMIVVLLCLYVSYKKKSVYLSVISMFLGYFTAIILGQNYSIFIIISVMSMVAFIFKYKFDWNSLFVFAIFFSFFSHLIWFLNNPFVGNRMLLVSHPISNIHFVLTYIFIFSLGNLYTKEDKPEDSGVIVSTFLITFLGYGIYLLLTVTKFNQNLFSAHLIASLLFLVLATLFWMRKESQFATFFYAIIGYTALSVFIISQFKSPHFFLWLCWQSLLVISTAIWFRSKFIVLANFFIFLIIFLAFVFMSGRSGWIGLNFGIVALLSARIMNWKKHRLDLKTEFMRNAYLVSSFFIIPHALYHIVPTSFISVSWIMTAIVYYLLSIQLKNKKYRWMALFTLILTIIYIFIIGITKLDVGYRIVSFIFLGVVLLTISILYARFRAKYSLENTGHERTDLAQKENDTI